MKINCCIIVTCLFYFSPFWKSKFPPDDAYRADTRKLGCKKTIPEDFLLTLQQYMYAEGEDATTDDTLRGMASQGGRKRKHLVTLGEGKGGERVRGVRGSLGDVEVTWRRRALIGWRSDVFPTCSGCASVSDGLTNTLTNSTYCWLMQRSGTVTFGHR